MTVTLSEYPALAAFLSEQIIGVVSLPITEDGDIHSAALHYWHQSDPLRFYFVTGKGSEKCALLHNGARVKAACVVGTTVGIAFTLQMRGTMRLVDLEKYQDVLNRYYDKRGDHARDITDPNNVLLEFSPSWARFTDYAKGYDHTYLDVS